MVTTLKKFLTARGDVFADVRSNTLIIRDIPSSIPKIDNLLRQIDRKSQQVEIDARVVQTSRSFAREIGTEFGFSAPTGVTGNTAFGGLTGLTSFPEPCHPLGGYSFLDGFWRDESNSAQYQSRRHRAEQRLHLLHAGPQLCDRLSAELDGDPRRRQDPFRTQGHHPEQRKVDGEARSASSDPDQHQQHDFRAVCGRRC